MSRSSNWSLEPKSWLRDSEIWLFRFLQGMNAKYCNMINMMTFKSYEIIWNPVLFDSGLVLQGKRSGTVYWVYCLLPLLPLVRHRLTPRCHVIIDHRLPSHPSHPSQVQWCQEDSAVVWSSNETTGSCDFAGTNITGKGKRGNIRKSCPNGNNLWSVPSTPATSQTSAHLVYLPAYLVLTK